LSGHQLEQLGWRQGSFISYDDLIKINPDLSIAPGTYGIVASHSCDIANQNLIDLPEVEIILAPIVDTVDNGLCGCRNPRKLHAPCKYKHDIVHVEVMHINSFKIDKLTLESIAPVEQLCLTVNGLRDFVAWLASQYSRPVWPTSFNGRLASADPRKKLKKIAKVISIDVSAIYMKLNPNREINNDETYSIQLLATLHPGSTAAQSDILKQLNKMKDIFTAAGFAVTINTQSESEVPISVLRTFQRLYWDDISLTNDHPLPIESPITDPSTT